MGERLSVAGSRLLGGLAPLKRRGAVAVCLSVTRGALPSSPALPAEGPASLPRFSVVAFTRLGAPETTLSFSAFSGRLGSWRGPPSGGHPHPAARGLGTGCRENVPPGRAGDQRPGAAGADAAWEARAAGWGRRHQGHQGHQGHVCLRSRPRPHRPRGPSTASASGSGRRAARASHTQDSNVLGATLIIWKRTSKINFRNIPFKPRIRKYRINS